MVYTSWSVWITVWNSNNYSERGHLHFWSIWIYTTAKPLHHKALGVVFLFSFAFSIHIRPYQPLPYLVYYWSQIGATVIAQCPGEPSKQSDPSKVNATQITYGRHPPGWKTRVYECVWHTFEHQSSEVKGRKLNKSWRLEGYFFTYTFPISNMK